MGPGQAAVYSMHEQYSSHSTYLYIMIIIQIQYNWSVPLIPWKREKLEQKPTTPQPTEIDT